MWTLAPRYTHMQKHSWCTPVRGPPYLTIPRVSQREKKNRARRQLNFPFNIPPATCSGWEAGKLCFPHLSASPWKFCLSPAEMVGDKATIFSRPTLFSPGRHSSLQRANESPWFRDTPLPWCLRSWAVSSSQPQEDRSSWATSFFFDSHPHPWRGKCLDNMLWRISTRRITWSLA